MKARTENNTKTISKHKEDFLKEHKSLSTTTKTKKKKLERRDGEKGGHNNEQQ